MSTLQTYLTIKSRVWLSTDVLTAIIADASQHAPNETGGILMGYWSTEPRAAVITHSIDSGPRAIHEKTRFVPDHEFQVSKVTQLFQQSGHRLEYLGDWHSHPGGPGHLSKKDRQALRTIATFPAARAANPLMLILAHGPEWEPVIWSMRRARYYMCLSQCVVERHELTLF